jgi:hypothetical protein
MQRTRTLIIALAVTCSLFTSCEANPTGPTTGIETTHPPDTTQLRSPDGTQQS